MTRYKVTCKNCKNFNIVPIEEKSRTIKWEGCDRIISGRYRLDNQWGWQCLCGNNSLLTKQEDEYITDKTNPDPKEIAEVINNLVVEKKQLFIMEKL